ncbi:MAG TPA: BamA/TamA family outer membrane protein [Polyangia bacterium]|nr:BamA/TamA family outer membrane protein [Polyangia bacterium]
MGLSTDGAPYERPLLADALAAVLAALLTASAPAAAAAPAPPAPPQAPPAASIDEAAAPAAETPTRLREDATRETSVPSFEPGFGPRYHIEEIVVKGNRKTRTALILREIGLETGDMVSASDQRVEAARFRLLALGYFLDARLSLVRGARRGGAVLQVEVEERGTIVVNELYPSTSAATTFWGGVDASETNFLGRGINVGAGFVLSTKPKVPQAERAVGLRLHGSLPEVRSLGVSLSLTGLYNDGSEFFRAMGADTDPDPLKFVAARTRRAGGILGAGKSLGRSLRVFADLREETVSSTFPIPRVRQLPGGQTAPIDFDIEAGRSHVGSLALTFDFDTRSDPILPRSGGRLVASLEGAHGWLGSSYDFVKTLVQASVYQRMPRGHALGFHLLAGAVFGEAPYFDRFFVGDLNLLLPRRALGINFSTLPSRNVLGTGVARHRYDDYAGRLLVEYAIPIWRRHGFVYGGDAFAALGIFALASRPDFDLPDPFAWRNLPLDLTADLGLRLDTYVGVFTISIANALSRSSF